MRIVYFGSGAFGLPTLKSLAENHDVVAVVTQPDRAAGRGGRLMPTPIADWVQSHHAKTPVFKPDRISGPAGLEHINEIRRIAGESPVFVVIAFGQKLPPALLDGAFAINLHASILPRWRGASPINSAILAGDAETGNSVITLADRMDAGLILAQTRSPINPLETAGDVHDRLSSEGPQLIERVLVGGGFDPPVVQDESRVTFAHKLNRTDAALDFKKSATDIRCRIHGLTPWPGVSVMMDGRQVKLLQVAAVEPHNSEAPPATLIDATRGLIQCGCNSAIQILRAQIAGRKPLDWSALIRGSPMCSGIAVSSRSE